MKVYLCGPMSHYPDLNYPSFHKHAAWLRSLGYEVLNPAENPEQEDWAGYMRVALRQVLDADMVATLANWQCSRGAKVEVDLANALGIPVLPINIVAESVKP